MNQPAFGLISAAVLAALSSQAFAESTPEQDTAKSARNNVEVLVVSGSRLEQNLQQVAGSVVVIDEEAIARNMSTDFSSLFRNEAAVDIKGGAGKATSVTIRGIGGNRVMMVKDGVRINNQYASPLGPGAEGTGRGLTEVESLKQVEVLKAAASTMYGSDALGGVVVMTSKDAADYLRGKDSYISANAGYTGMNNEWGAGFTFANAYGNFESLISYQHRDGEEQQNYDGTLPDSNLLNDSVLLKSKYHFNAHTNLQFTFDYLNQQLDRWETTPQRAIDYDRTTQAMNTSLRLRSNKATSFHDNMDVVFYYGYTDQNEYREYRANDSLYEVRDYDFEESRLGLSSTFNKKIGSENYSHKITYGFDFESSDMSRPRDYRVLGDNGVWGPSGSDLFAFADTDSVRTGLFIQDDISLLSDKLNVIGGLRYDYFKHTPDQQQAADAGRDPINFEEISDGFWSPKFGVIYHLTNTVSVYSQYAYGYKMPTPDQKWGELEVKDGNMPFPVLINPNYDLTSEESHTFEVGVRGNHANTSYELTTFYTKANDYIDWQFDGIDTCIPVLTCPPGTTIPVLGLNYSYFNRDHVTLYGAEASANHWLNNDIMLWGNIAYTYGEDENGNYLNTVSPLKGSVGLNYHLYAFGIPSELGSTVRFADQMNRTTDLDIFPGSPSFNEVYNTAGYAVMDLTISAEVTSQWLVRAGVYNLLDKEYMEYADVAGQSKFLLNTMGTPDSNFTQPGRYFNVNVRYTF